MKPVRVPRFVTAIILEWSPIDRGRVGGVFAFLEGDEWRFSNRLDWALPQSDMEEMGLTPDETVWAVAHARVTVAFIETAEAVNVVYINRRSAFSPGW